MPAILDAPVFPSADPEARRLVRFFASAFEIEEEALRFAELVNVDRLVLPRGKGPLALWYDILQEAARVGAVRALVERAIAAMPNNPDISLLQRLLADGAVSSDSAAGNEDAYLERYLISLERDLDYLTAAADQNLRLKDAFVERCLVAKGAMARVAWPNLDWERPIAIVGGAGAGKSTLLRHLAYVMARRCRAVGATVDALRRESLRVPILIDLQELAELDVSGINALDLAPLLARSGLSQYAAAQLVDNGDALLIFDKFDEVGDEATRLRLAERIRRLQGGGKRPAAIVLASRERAFPDDIGGFVRLSVEPLTPEQIEVFVAKSVGSEPSTLARIQKTLRGSPRLRAIARNPQLLTMLLSVLREDPTRSLGHRVLIYEECVQRMTRDAKRFVERSADELMAMLSALALKMRTSGMPKLESARVQEVLRAFGGDVDDKIEALELGTGLIVADGRRRVEFVHPTFQEYFVAREYAETESGRQVLLEHVQDPTWSEILALAAGVLADRFSESLCDFFTALLDTPANAAGGTLAPDVLRAWAPRVAAASVCFDDLECWDLAPSTLAPVRRAHQMILPLLESEQINIRNRVEIANGLGAFEDPRLSKERWVPLDAVTTWIGSSSQEAWPQEKPPRRVSVSGFWMQRWLVTVGEYRRFIDDGGYLTRAWWDPEGVAWLAASEKPVRPLHWEVQSISNHPVTGISYWEACAYCRWFSSVSGIPNGWAVRLPTECEWERAARGPRELENERPRFPWGDSWDERAANCASSGFGLVPVGIFAPSPLGLWDITGNVMERCLDRFLPNGTELGKRPLEHAVRGGSYASSPLDLRVSVRNGIPPEQRLNDLGFRCVAAPLGEAGET